ncbi:MAG: winged helix-turn-helix domain-containing protein [Desulfuromonadales bacterium]|nr:winged helix-turn-helix domain-containing protein [Desulfuromonadales bacterium]
MSQLRIRSKVWLEVNGQPFLGDGRYRLLSAVQRKGSINAAAKEMGMSYRKVWSQLQAMEETAPFPLIERRTGGSGGGASRLTPETLDLMQRFERLRDQVNNEADRCFLSCFDQRNYSVDA